MTPGCSTCGYAVEWLRSCYESEWQLFKDRPDIRTPGRYVRSAPAAPHFPGWHNLGSGTWTSDERDPQPALGEVNEAKRVWSSGSPPLPSAPAILVGSLGCLAEGETYPLPLIDRTFPGNWDSRCFEGLPPPPATPIPVPDIFLCKSQSQWITAIRLLAEGDTVGAVAILQLNLPGYTITAAPWTAGPIPGTLIAVLGDSVVVLVGGTPDGTTWSYQLTSGTLGPTEYGWYSTLRFWREASDIILQRMQAAGLQGTDRVTLIGYSLGGAMCCVLAARFLMFQPLRNVQLLTYGSPRPGDARMVALLRGARQMHFVNVDDPIPYLPPGVNELGYVANLVPDSLVERWSSWRPQDNRVGLTPEGIRFDNPPSTGLVGLIFRTVTRLLLLQEPPVAIAHNAVEYERRVICPDDPPPGKLPADPFRDVLLWLRPEYLDSAYVLGEEIPMWGDDGPYGFDATEGPFLNLIFVGDDGAPVSTVAEMKRGAAFQIPPLGLGNAHSVYAVTSWKRPVDAAQLAIRLFGVGGFCFNLVANTSIFRYSSANTIVQGNFGTPSGLHVWSSRRRPANVELMVDGALLASGAADPVGTITVNGLQALPAVGTATTRCWLAELLIFGKEVDDDQQQALFDYFTSRYGVP